MMQIVLNLMLWGKYVSEGEHDSVEAKTPATLPGFDPFSPASSGLSQQRRCLVKGPYGTSPDGGSREGLGS